MKFTRKRRYALLLAGLILIPLLPLLLWVGVILVAPTGWATRQLVAAMESRSGRFVGLEGVSVRLLGGVQLTKLEIGSPQSIDDPWLKTANVRLDFSLRQLLSGKFQPAAVHVESASLRVLRRDDGSLELADLVLRGPKPIGPSGRADRGMDRLAVGLRNCTVNVIDEPSQTRLHLQNVEGQGEVDAERITIHQMRGVLNGGAFQFTGQLHRSAVSPTVNAHFRAEGVVLDDGMRVLRYAVPVLSGASLNLKGHLNSDVYVQGQGRTWDVLSRSMVGHGVIALDPIDLHGAPLVAELSKIAELSRRGGCASIHTDFEIKDRRITTDHFALDIGRVPMTLSGWTDFDGRVDYRINLSGLNDRIPDKARRILGDLNVDLQSLRTLTLQGTVNRMVVTLNGISLDKDLLRETGLKRTDRDKLRVLGRKLLDELVR